MANFRALASGLGTTQGALVVAAEIASLAERLKDATYRADQAGELLAIRDGLEHVGFVLSRLRHGVKRRIAELEGALGQQ